MRRTGDRVITTLLVVLMGIASVASVGGSPLGHANAEDGGAVLIGVVFDQGIDTDGDGAFNYLEIGVELNVTAGGDYSLQVSGLTSAFGFIFVGAYPSLSLETGVQTVTLRFVGTAIYTSGLNPVNVSSIELYDAEYRLLGVLSEVPLSREYAYTEFDAPGAVLMGVVSDQGVDSDGNGAFDVLEMGVEVNVTEAGEYNLQAYGLLTNDLDYIHVGDSQTAVLDVGLQVINLRFDGPTIYSSGLNASSVSNLYLYDSDYNTLGDLLDLPLSQTYGFEEFDAPGARLTGVIHDRGVDLDDDGLFNVLEVGIEVNITEAGEYNLQAYGLLTNDLDYIDVGDSQTAVLDVGLQVINLRFDGPMIAASGLNATSVSTIHLFDDAYSTLDEAHEVALSRSYAYSEFEGMTPVAVGVDAGAWAKYNVTMSWESTDPSAPQPPQLVLMQEIAWVTIEVESVDDTVLHLVQTYRFENGTDMPPQAMSGDLAAQFLTMVIPRDLAAGDVIPGTAASINGTVTRTYAGQNRTVNWLGYTGSFFDINMTQRMHWDQATGILCELFMETSILEEEGVTTTTMELTMIETNLWTIATALTSAPSKAALTEGDSLVVAGAITPPLSGITVTVMYQRPDGSTGNRTVTTTVDGHYSDTYTPTTTGTWRVTASWAGNATHGSATSAAQSFTVTAKPFLETPGGMAAVAGGGIVVVAALVLILRRRPRSPPPA